MTDTRPDWKALSPAEKIDAIRPMVLAGATSRQIAARFVNCSRNSIISVCSRQRGDVKLLTKGGPVDLDGVPIRKKVKPAKVRAPIAARRSSEANYLGAQINMTKARKAPTPVDDEIDVGIDVSHLLGLMDLERTSCRWPVTGTGSGTLFCGAHATHGPYCDKHAARAGLGYGRGPRP